MKCITCGKETGSAHAPECQVCQDNRYKARLKGGAAGKSHTEKEGDEK